MSQDGQPLTAIDLQHWLTAFLPTVSPQAQAIATTLHNSKAWGITPFAKRRDLIRSAALACDAHRPEVTPKL